MSPERGPAQWTVLLNFGDPRKYVLAENFNKEQSEG